MALSDQEMDGLSRKVLKQLVSETGLKFGPALTQKVKNLAKVLGLPTSTVSQFVTQLIEEMTNDALRLLR